MPEPRAKHTVRYMDFISRKPSANSDPLASRPVARRVQPKVVKKVSSVADQIPTKPYHYERVTTTVVSRETLTPTPAPKPKPMAEGTVAVKKEEFKPYISRQPATSRDLYPETVTPQKPEASSLSVKLSDNLHEEKPLTQAAAPDNNAYSLSGKSPFLANYNIDKRPLSDSVPVKKKDDNFEKLSFLGVSEQSSESSHRKNVYDKSDSPEESKKKDKTVKIIDDTKKSSGFPTWAIILITIILGMAVGVGVYYLLPK